MQPEVIAVTVKNDIEVHPGHVARLPAMQKKAETLGSFIDVCVQQGYGAPIHMVNLLDFGDKGIFNNVVILDHPENKDTHLFISRSGLMFLVQDKGQKPGKNYVRARSGELYQARRDSVEKLIREMSHSNWNSKLLGRSDVDDQFLKEKAWPIISYYADRIKRTLHNIPTLKQSPLIA